MPQPCKADNQRWSYADYLTWPDGERWELINGVAYNMSPAPGVVHQRISMELSRQFAMHLKGRPCQVFAAPFAVRLAEQLSASDNYVDTVVQPDLVVVCDKSKLDERGCNGAPDLVVEILSPSSAGHDLKTKYDLYERYGVSEYWIIHPAEKTLLVYQLDQQGKYGAAGRFAGDDNVPVLLLGELVVDLADVFAE